MPHDVKGNRIGEGDWVMTRPLNRGGVIVVGRVVKIRAEEQRCTGEVRWQGFGQLEQDFFDADDAVLLLAADGTPAHVLAALLPPRQ